MYRRWLTDYIALCGMALLAEVAIRKLAHSPHPIGAGGEFRSKVFVPSASLFRGAVLCVRPCSLAALRRRGNSQARFHQLRVGEPTGLRQSGAMPPVSLQHSLHATTAAHNKFVNTDAYGRPPASPALSAGAGYGQR